VLASVANKGVRVAPRVIDAWIDAEGKETAQTQPEGVRVISEASATTLTEMLIGVTQEGGTAESASIDGYLVAGKTGTTEILTEPGTVASFVGFTPARDPAIAVAVIVYRPDWHLRWNRGGPGLPQDRPGLHALPGYRPGPDGHRCQGGR